MFLCTANTRGYCRSWKYVMNAMHYFIFAPAPVHLCGLLLLFIKQVKELWARCSGDAIPTLLGASMCAERRPLWSQSVSKQTTQRWSLDSWRLRALPKWQFLLVGVVERQRFHIDISGENMCREPSFMCVWKWWALYSQLQVQTENFWMTVSWPL